MKTDDLPDSAALAEADLLLPLLHRPATAPHAPPVLAAPVIGELLALAEGAIPLVRHPLQASPTALRARSTVDLHGAHIGRSVLLVFEQGDAERPVVVGVLRDEAGWPLAEAPAQVQVDADGQRLVVSANEQLVLRCGKASITLTKGGKVLIEGSYVSSRSTGVNRVKGGSVQLN